MGLLSNIGKGIAKALDITSVALAKPVATVKAIISPTQTVSQLSKEFEQQSTGKKVGQIIVGTAGLMATVAGAGAVATAAKAGTLKAAVTTAAKSLIPSTPKGKSVATVTALAVGGAIAKEPVAVAKLVAKAPGEVVQFGGDVATFASNPSIETAKQIVKESPIISTAAALLTVGGVAKAVLPAIATTRQTEAIQEQTEAIKANVPTTPIYAGDQGFKITEIKPAQPQTIAQTKTVSADTPKKPRKRSTIKKREPTSINQRVNVIVSNRSSSVGIRNTKYIKERILV